MTYYDDIVRLMRWIKEDIYNYDHHENSNRPSATLEEIVEKIGLLQMRFNQQVVEFHDWIMQRKNMI